MVPLHIAWCHGINQTTGEYDAAGMVITDQEDEEVIDPENGSGPWPHDGQLTHYDFDHHDSPYLDSVTFDGVKKCDPSVYHYTFPAVETSAFAKVTT